MLTETANNLPDRPTYTDADYARLITKIIAMTGMTSEIEDYEIALAINFLKKHYRPRPHPSKANVVIYSPEYLARVWEWGIAGHYPMPKPFRLSLGYISEVMGNFKEWRKVENTKPKPTKPEVKALPPKQEIESCKAIARIEFERFKVKGIVLTGVACYDSLVSLGHFDPTLWEDYRHEAATRERIEREEKAKNSGSMFKIRELLGNLTDATIKSRAKQIAVEEYYKTIDTLEL